MSRGEEVMHMHLLKLKLTAAKGMFTYDGREPGDYVNPETHGETLDPQRTADNYAFACGTREDGSYGPVVCSPHSASEKCSKALDDARALHIKTTGKNPRKDAVGAGQWVITLPKGVPVEQAGVFFAWMFLFMRERYGKENVPAMFIHMDETTPHAHVPVLAMKDNRFQAKNLFNRKELSTIHQDAEKAMHVRGFSGLLLSEDQRLQKALSKLSRDELNAVNEYINAVVADETRTERKELEKGRETLAKDEKAVRDRENACNEKERSLERMKNGLSDRADMLNAAWQTIQTMKEDVKAQVNRMIDEGLEKREIKQRMHAYIESVEDDIEEIEDYKTPAQTPYYPDL